MNNFYRFCTEKLSKPPWVIRQRTIGSNKVSRSGKTEFNASIEEESRREIPGRITTLYFLLAIRPVCDLAVFDDVILNVSLF